MILLTKQTKSQVLPTLKASTVICKRETKLQTEKEAQIYQQTKLKQWGGSMHTEYSHYR